MATARYIKQMYEAAGKRVYVGPGVEPYLGEEVDEVIGDASRWSRFGKGYSQHLVLSNSTTGHKSELSIKRR